MPGVSLGAVRGPAHDLLRLLCLIRREQGVVNLVAVDEQHEFLLVREAQVPCVARRARVAKIRYST